MKRWLPRALVILTAVLCLGTAGYAGQAWWAKEYARYNVDHILDGSDSTLDLSSEVKVFFSDWRHAPWYGENRWLFGKGWKPRRAYWEVAKLATGQDLPDDPDAWEAWYKAHPGLVWDPKSKRFKSP